MDAKDWSSENGTPVQIWACGGGSNQQWSYDGSHIKGLGGKCISVDGNKSTNESKLLLWDCVDAPGQQWSVRDDGTIRGIDGKCIDAAGVSSADGTLLQIYDCWNGSNQLWKLSSGAGSGGAGSGGVPTGGGGVSSGGAPPGEDPSAWVPIYKDEFDALNTNLWQDHFWWGGRTISDGAISYFSPNNISVHDGYADLLINNNQEGGMNYTSATLQSYGTIHFTYGYVEFRARCDRGSGLSCDFALNAEDKTWPPEINIAEIPYSQSKYNQYYAANHRRPDNVTHDAFPVGDDSTQWHTYGLLWDAGRFTWYFEGQQVYSETADVFDAPMNFSIYYGVAANDWSGYVNAATPFPAHALVDYVRIYQRK